MSEPSRDAVAEALLFADMFPQVTHDMAYFERHIKPLAAEVRRLQARENEQGWQGHALVGKVRGLEAELGRRGAAPDGLLREAVHVLYNRYVGRAGGMHIDLTRTQEYAVKDFIAAPPAALSALLDAPPPKN